MCLVGYGPYAYMCEKYLNLSNSSLILRNPSKPDNLLEEPKGTFYDSVGGLWNEQFARKKYGGIHRPPQEREYFKPLGNRVKD